MTIKKLLLVLLILITLNAVSVYAQACGGNIAVSTTMVANLNCANNGVRIIGNNLVFDCAGFNITGNKAVNSYGIRIDTVRNVTVKNCNIYKFRRGIEIDDSNDSFVYNNTATNITPGGYGFRLLSGNDNITLVNNTASLCTYDGFEVSASPNNYHKFINNKVINNFGDGFNLRGMDFSDVINNSVNLTSTGDGIQVGPFSENNTIHGNVVNNCGGRGIVITSDWNNVTNNTAYNNQQAGFLINSGTNNRISRNTAYNNSQEGIVLFGGVVNTLLINNKAYNNTLSGFLIRQLTSGVNTVSNNTAYNNDGSGFNVFDCNNTIISNNTAYYNNLSGIYLHKGGSGGPGSNVSVRNNLVYNNSGHGIFIFNTSNEFIINNTIQFNNLSGIQLQMADNINITLNTVLNHSTSINLLNSDNNWIYNNYFGDLPAADAASIGNSWNIAKTAGTNIIGGPFLGGNFWRLYNGTDLDTDGLGDTLLPWKGQTNGIVNGGDIHPLTSWYVIGLQCEFNNSGTFLNCNNATFFANITRVRVNCTPLNGIVSNATFNLTNLFDSNTFFVNTTSTVIGGYYVLDNPDVQILDSGNWTVDATCTNASGAKQNGTYLFNIPFGTPSVSVVTPPGDINVPNGTTFNVTCRMQCSGGECVNVNVTLDPLNPLTNLTQPTLQVHAVYADSQFIYGASSDNAVYVWNKTNLALFAAVNTSMPLRSVFADSQYIYAGGVFGITGNLTIWNRTDLATPFASVVNISFPGGVYGVKSDNNYIYAGGGLGFGAPGFLTVYNKSTFASIVNLTFNDIVRGIDIDNASIYTVSHACEVNVTSIAGFAPVTNLPVPAGCSQTKAISVDDDYIIATGHSLVFPFPPAGWTRIYNKSTYAVLFEYNETTLPSWTLASDAGSPDFAYSGGASGGPPANGFLNQFNKTALALNDSINFSGWSVKGLYCDNDYLYAAMSGWLTGNGMVMLFNNTCPTGPAPPPVVTINSLTVLPSPLPVPSTAYCFANVTTAGTIANVTFNVTFPGGGSLLLPGTNVGGDIYNSSAFNVTALGMHVCTVFANNTNGSSATRSRNFYAGNKGTVPMNSGSPFYTINQNPRYPANQSCLNSSQPGQICNSSWNVTVNGTNQTTWQFFCIYESAQSGDANTSKVNITIGAPTPPPPTPRRSSGGGGGGAARSWQQLEEELQEEVCVEAWLCDPWADCEFGETNRFCVDMNACGTEKNRPPESMHCKVEEIIVEEPSLLKDVDIKEIQEEKLKPTVVKGPEEKPSIFTSRNALRAALLAIVLGALIYIFTLSKFLRARKVKPKKAIMKEEAFKPKKEPVKKIIPKEPIKKPKPKEPVKKVQPRKKPEKLPKDTEGLLDVLNKL